MGPGRWHIVPWTTMMSFNVYRLWTRSFLSDPCSPTNGHRSHHPIPSWHAQGGSLMDTTLPNGSKNKKKDGLPFYLTRLNHISYHILWFYTNIILFQSIMIVTRIPCLQKIASGRHCAHSWICWGADRAVCSFLISIHSAFLQLVVVGWVSRGLFCLCLPSRPLTGDRWARPLLVTAMAHEGKMPSHRRRKEEIKTRKRWSVVGTLNVSLPWFSLWSTGKRVLIHLI